jgi:hypothetical protein
MTIPKAGDIFRFSITSNEFAFGRIMLNITAQCVKTKKIDRDNALWPFKEYLLVQVYQQTTKGDTPSQNDILLPGIMISDGCIEEKTWETVDFKEVKPQEVEFPEGLSSEKSFTGAFIKGECKIVFAMEFSEIEKIDIPPIGNSCKILSEVVLFQLGRKDEIDNPLLTNKEFRNPASFDLRFSRYREKIFELAGIDPGESYYELSKRLGFDVSRFY